MGGHSAGFMATGNWNNADGFIYTSIYWQLR